MLTTKAIVLVAIGLDQNAEDLEKFLRANRYEPIIVHYAEQAMGVLKERPIDLALVDMKLPDCMGLEATVAIRKAAPDSEVIVIVDPMDLPLAMVAMSESAFGYVTRPIDFNLLLALLSKAFEKQQLAVENRKMVRKFSALSAIARIMAQPMDLNKTIVDALNETLKIFSADVGAIYLLDPASQELTLYNYRGVSAQTALRVRKMKVGEGTPGLAAKTGEVLLIPDLSSDARVLWKQEVKAERLKSFAWVPLKAKDKILGVLGVGFHRVTSFTPDELALLTSISNQLAVGIDNASLFDQLQGSEEKYRTLIEKMIEGVWVVDENLKINMVNSRMGDLLEYQPSEMVGTDIASYFDEAGRKIIEEKRKARRTGLSEIYEAEAVAKSGRRVFLRISASPLFDTEGSFLGSFAVVTDITERKKFEEEIRQRNMELVTLNIIATTVSKFLGLQEVLDNALEKVLGLMKLDVGVIFLLDGGRRELIPKAYHGIAPEFLRHVKRVRLEDGLTGQAAKSGALLVVENIGDDPRITQIADKQRSITSHVSVPIKSKGRVLGVMDLDSFAPRHFSPEDLQLLDSIGAVIGVAVENALLFEETKKQRDKLRESEYKYRTVVENANDAIYIVQDGRFRYVNNKSIELTGYTAEELYRMNFSDLARDEDARKASAIYQKRLLGEDLPSYEIAITHKDGTRRLVHISGSVIEYEGKPAIQGVARDVTEKREAEKQVRRLAAAVESLHSCVIISDLDGKIVYLNPIFEKIFRYRIDEIIGQHSSILYAADNAMELWRDVCEATHVGGWEGELLNRRKDGETFPVYMKTSVVRDHSDKAVALVSAVEDISEKKILQQQLLQSEKMSAIGKLISGIAHEINNPLTAIIGYSQFLLAREAEGQVRREAERIHNQAERTVRIVQNLLSFARQHKPTRSYIDINEVIRRSISLRAYEMKVNNIELVEEFQPNLPYTMADPHQLQQVFMNIIINAEQAMLDAYGWGKLSIRTSVVHQKALWLPGNDHNSKDGVKSPYGKRPVSWIRIEFTDNGPGIRQDVLERIFDPFFTTKPIGKGTGLGLSICYGIVQEHGGKIYAESREGLGASFIVEVPVIEQEAKPIPPPAEAEQLPLAGKRFLVIDDEENITDVVVTFLNTQGSSVDAVHNGMEALKRIAGNDYDFVISDVLMPELDGKMLYQAIKNRRPALSRRLLFMTGDIVSNETLSFFDQVNAVYIPKPFTFDELKSAILRVWKGTGAG